jgi:hypothetical protein
MEKKMRISGRAQKKLPFFRKKNALWWNEAEPRWIDRSESSFFSEPKVLLFALTSSLVCAKHRYLRNIGVCET